MKEEHASAAIIVVALADERVALTGVWACCTIRRQCHLSMRQNPQLKSLVGNGDPARPTPRERAETMGSGKELDGKAVRKRLKPETGTAVIEALGKGFRVREFGHGVKLFCPCMGPHTFSVSGTPRSDDREAARVRRAVKQCPEVQD